MEHENLNNQETAQLGIGAVSTRFLSELSDIRPCPFCGNKMPFSYYNPSTAYLGCDDCGVNFGNKAIEAIGFCKNYGQEYFEKLIENHLQWYNVKYAICKLVE